MIDVVIAVKMNKLLEAVNDRRVKVNEARAALRKISSNAKSLSKSCNWVMEAKRLIRKRNTKTLRSRRKPSRKLKKGISYASLRCKWETITLTPRLTMTEEM